MTLRVETETWIDKRFWQMLVARTTIFSQISCVQLVERAHLDLVLVEGCLDWGLCLPIPALFN